jgi:uncharacterized surface protein with fasciclin (FAS1) repeats
MPKSLAAAAALVVGLSLATQAAPQGKDIVDTAIAAGNFTILAKLLTEADLVTVMKSPGPFTVFAPTDDAFAKVPKATLDALAKDKAMLRRVLTYHVLTSRWSIDQLKVVPSTGTVNSKHVTIKMDGGTMMINDARVVMADIGCANGVIHVIDTVLIPQ